MLNYGRYALRSAFITITWIPVALTFSEHVCYVAKVEGASMRPTLNPSDPVRNESDWVLLWKFNLKQAKNWKENDVVLFKSPMDPKKVYCKRVKGMQFDQVRTRSPYPKETCLVPRNHLWVEGDNVYHSVDSNNFGPISTGLVLGKAVCIVWPPSRWSNNLNMSNGRGDIKVFPVDPQD
ncbi:Mitochondrial inner membrane protease subunit 2 [Kluyveromyces marxianus]|nr:hypothetical protein C6P43_004162 [Kluyveromyces marxianus]KAG0676302.1 hypothetical protein C6P41_001770 [Kluyveromyces marxianus]